MGYFLRHLETDLRALRWVYCGPKLVYLLLAVFVIFGSAKHWFHDDTRGWKLSYCAFCSCVMTVKAIP